MCSLRWTWAMLVLTACGPQIGPAPEVSSFGHVELTVKSYELTALTDPLTIKVGGVRAYDVHREAPDTVRFTVQGAPAPGRVEIWAAGRAGTAHIGDVAYFPPVDPRFSRLVAFGASLTMGMQDASLSRRSQLHGPAAQVARAAGAFMGLPLIRDGILTGLAASNFDPQTCRAKGDIWQQLEDSAVSQLLSSLKDTDGNIRVEKARVDPDVEVRDVAIGGFRVGQMVSGAGSGLGVPMQHFVWNPRVKPADLFYEPPQKMMDRVADANPTLVICTDLIANEYSNLDLRSTGLPDLSAITPLEQFKPALAMLVSRLEATGAEVFLATGPDITVLPMFQDKVAELLAQGYGASEAEGWRNEVRSRIDAFNAELRSQVAGRERFHLVDVHARAAEVLVQGADIGANHVTGAPFGGLLSLDMLHFSDTGYALMANEFIATINRDLGTSVPLVDVEQALADDPYSVEHLRAAGLTCAGR